MTTTNNPLLDDDSKYLWHPFSQEKIDSKILIEKGKGAILFDDQNNPYIDAISSWWVNLHGHSHPYINTAIQKQLEKLEHVIFAGFTHQPAIDLGRRLIGHLPSHISRVFFSDDGSTAVEVSLKMAMQFWYNKNIKKTKVIAFKGAYHGDTLGAMSIGDPDSFVAPFKHMLFDVIHIDPPLPGKEKDSFEQLKTALSDKSVAAFIFEPLIQATAGMLIQDKKTLSQMIELCQNKNVLTIADEVMTGFGRTGTWFAIDQLDFKPDIMCLSKGITGGYMAMGVTVCSERIYHAFYSDDRSKCFLHGHSYTANPIACAIACASMDLMEKQETWDNIENIKNQHLSILPEFESNNKISSVRTLGTLLAIEIKTQNATSYFNPLRDQLYDYFLNEGILLRPLGNIIYILPPYCIKKSDLQKIYATIFRALDSPEL